MALPYSKIIESPLCSISVGNEGEEFYVHFALLDFHFEHIWRIPHQIFGPQGQELPQFQLENVDGPIIALAAEFFYTGNYRPIAINGPTLTKAVELKEKDSSPGQPDLKLESVDPPAADAEGPKDDAGNETGHIAPAAAEASTAVKNTAGPSMEQETKPINSLTRKPSPKDPSVESVMGPYAQARIKFTAKDYSSDLDKAKAIQAAEEARQDQSDHLLCHVSVYSFAKKYDIHSLRKIALKNLHCLLKNSMLSDSSNLSAEKIVQLIRYTYHKTSPLTGGVDELRELVSHYAAVQSNILWMEKCFRDLYGEPGDFSMDVLHAFTDQGLGKPSLRK